MERLIDKELKQEYILSDFPSLVNRGSLAEIYVLTGTVPYLELIQRTMGYGILPVKPHEKLLSGRKNSSCK